MKKFVVNGGHRGHVTCAEWSTNGMKLFTGDTTGSVVYTEVDFYKVHITILYIIMLTSFRWLYFLQILLMLKLRQFKTSRN